MLGAAAAQADTYAQHVALCKKLITEKTPAGLMYEYKVANDRFGGSIITEFGTIMGGGIATALGFQAGGAPGVVIGGATLAALGKEYSDGHKIDLEAKCLVEFHPELFQESSAVITENTPKPQVSVAVAVSENGRSRAVAQAK